MSKTPGMPELRQGVTEKSVFNPDDRIQYCKNMSIRSVERTLQRNVPCKGMDCSRQTPEEAELTKATVERGSRIRMLGAPEALHLCANLIKLTKVFKPRLLLRA